MDVFVCLFFSILRYSCSKCIFIVIIQHFSFFLISRQTVLIEPFQNTNTKIHIKDGDLQPAFIFLSKFSIATLQHLSAPFHISCSIIHLSAAAKNNHLTKAARVDKNKQCKDATACSPSTQKQTALNYWTEKDGMERFSLVNLLRW